MRGRELAAANESEAVTMARATVTPLSADSPAPEQLLTIGQLAAFLNITTQTLYDWRSEGKGPVAIKVGQLVRYRLADVEVWLEAHREPAE